MSIELATNLRHGPKGRIDFASHNPFEYTQILQGKMGDTHSVYGSLLFPDAYEGPIPCMIACHGSYNWRGHHYEHISKILDMGIAVFRIHSFDTRGTGDVSKDQMSVTAAMLTADAFKALHLAASHPDIDASRIGLAGWSLGGSVALYAAWEPVAEALAPDGLRFAAHLPVYPAAYLRPEDDRWTGAPIRILIGSDEDYTPASAALEQTKHLAAKGVPIECLTYEGGHHAFDSIDYVEYMPDVIALNEGITVTVRKDGSMVVTGTEIDVSTPEGRMAGFADLVHLGAHVGGNRPGRRKAFKDVESFLRSTLLK